MFERRLKILLFILTVPTVVLVLRLAQLQLLQTEACQQSIRAMLLRPVRFYPALRGRITDRQGHPLAYDAPSWDISVHYGVLARDPGYLQALAEQYASADRPVGARERVQAAIEASWMAIARLTNTKGEDLTRTAGAIVERVRQMRLFISTRRGADTPIAEEHMFHPVARDLDRDAAVEARLQLAEYPWIEVVPGHVRRYAGGPSCGHFLGLLREVGRDTIENDPLFNDELARYRPGDRFGFIGVEAMAEHTLRGRRGRERLDLEGQLVGSAETPRDGGDFRLTIDLPLQQAVYDLLADAVRRYPYSTGGSAVILDVASRDILAMVSFPSFDPNLPWDKRLLLAGDKLHQPLSCRAIGQGGGYPPGSTVKPMILAAALTEGKVRPDEHIFCRGYLLPEAPDRWACSAQWGHGDVDPVYSIQHSCNVFYYVVAERMGVRSVSSWMARFGLGAVAGTGLGEEKAGRLPGSGGKGDARNMGIGQGQLEATPLQMANVTATLATSQFRPASLWADNPDPRRPQTLPIPQEYWRIVRRGMYLAVNGPGGTAFGPDRATLPTDCPYILLGKTGSAEAPAQEWLYTCRFADGRTETLRARNFRELLARYPDGQKIELLGQQPAAKYPTHAWFVGYLAVRDRPEDPVRLDDGSLAIAVVIEYAGHGGEVAACVARDMVLAALRQRGLMASTDTGPGGRP